MQGINMLPVTAAGTCLAFALATMLAGADASPPPASALAPLLAESPASAPALPGPATAAGAAVEIEILEDISSGTRSRGDVFPIRLASPLVVDGIERLPAHVPGIGQVVHAARSRAGGGPGELQVTVRALHWGERCIPLRGFVLGGSGRNAIALSAGVSSAVGVVGLLIRGKELVIPAGTRGSDRLRDGLADPPPDIPAPTEASSLEPVTTKEIDPCVIA